MKKHEIQRNIGKLSKHEIRLRAEDAERYIKAKKIFKMLKK